MAMTPSAMPAMTVITQSGQAIPNLGISHKQGSQCLRFPDSSYSIYMA